MQLEESVEKEAERMNLTSSVANVLALLTFQHQHPERRTPFRRMLLYPEDWKLYATIMGWSNLRPVDLQKNTVPRGSAFYEALMDYTKQETSDPYDCRAIRRMVLPKKRKTNSAKKKKESDYAFRTLSEWRTAYLAHPEWHQETGVERRKNPEFRDFDRQFSAYAKTLQGRASQHYFRRARRLVYAPSSTIIIEERHLH
ncbi:hypothetical protein C4573_02465 [Candidatus Woesearchaeota archaeon]|nr:MAG: hypothetical protein C4573_02465 [Candidatus Woesearchaeota archaeon]